MDNNQPFHIGVVEDIKDPLQIGRVRVRVFGVHTDNQNELPTSELYWCQTSVPLADAPVSGYGKSVSNLKQGATVLVIFLDGNENAQHPVIMGALVGGVLPTNRPSFRDVDSIYPNTTAVDDQPDEATSRFTTSESYKQKQRSRILNIPVGTAVELPDAEGKAEKLSRFRGVSWAVAFSEFDEILKDVIREFGSVGGVNSSRYPQDIPPPSLCSSLLGAVEKIAASNDSPPALSSSIFNSLANLSANNKSVEKSFQDKINNVFLNVEVNPSIVSNEIATALKNARGTDQNFSFLREDEISLSDSIILAQAEDAIESILINAAVIREEDELITPENAKDKFLEKIGDYAQENPIILAAAEKLNLVSDNLDAEMVGEAIAASSPAVFNQTLEASKSYSSISRIASKNSDIAKNLMKSLAKNGALGKLGKELANDFTDNGTSEAQEVIEGIAESSAEEIVSAIANDEDIANELFDEITSDQAAMRYVSEIIENRISQNSSFEAFIARQQQIENQQEGRFFWSSPNDSLFNAPVYPFNRVYRGVSGNVLEIDDTPGRERISIHHKTGTTTSVYSNGDKSETIVGDGFEINLKSKRVFVDGNYDLTVNGDHRVLVNGNYKLEVRGNKVESVEGFSHIHVKGAMKFFTSVIAPFFKGLAERAYESVFAKNLAWVSGKLIPAPTLIPKEPEDEEKDTEYFDKFTKYLQYAQQYTEQFVPKISGEDVRKAFTDAKSEILAAGKQGLSLNDFNSDLFNSKIRDALVAYAGSNAEVLHFCNLRILEEKLISGAIDASIYFTSRLLKNEKFSNSSALSFIQQNSKIISDFYKL